MKSQLLVVLRSSIIHGGPQAKYTPKICCRSSYKNIVPLKPYFCVRLQTIDRNNHGQTLSMCMQKVPCQYICRGTIGFSAMFYLLWKVASACCFTPQVEVKYGHKAPKNSVEIRDEKIY